MNFDKKSPVIVVMIITFGMFLSAGGSSRKVKNIIFMVPDGMGISNVTAARVYAHGANGPRLRFETLEQIGYQSTHAKDNMVTDSAASASAWACGEKFKNGEISYHIDSGRTPETILEMAIKMGRSTGLVTTSTVTHATAAAFAAHTGNRRCQNEIARQYIQETEVDVILGAGKGVFNSSEHHEDPCGIHGDFIQAAVQKKYRIVYTRAEMLDVGVPEKLLGLFGHNSLTPHYRRPDVETSALEPRLSEMTRKALHILERNPKGFFLVVEGSQIDWANHEKNLAYQIGETLAFDRAVGVVLDWAKAERNRPRETLIIIVPDHDTGGFSITGASDLALKGSGHFVESAWVSGGNHTGEDTIIWSQGPYSEHLGKAIDNTDIFHIMKAALLGLPYRKTGSSFDITSLEE